MSYAWVNNIIRDIHAENKIETARKINGKKKFKKKTIRFQFHRMLCVEKDEAVAVYQWDRFIQAFRRRTERLPFHIRMNSFDCYVLNEHWRRRHRRRHRHRHSSSERYLLFFHVTQFTHISVNYE